MNLQVVRRMGPAREPRKRVGRGRGTGLGKTSGRGSKGQGQHASGGRHKLGFEGGQMPLFRRLPKRGFTNARFRKVYTIVNIDRLASFDEGATVDFQAVCRMGLVSPEGDRLKVLGGGELKKKLHVVAHRFSASARKKVEAAGGSVKELEPRPLRPVRPAPAPARAAAPPSAKTEKREGKPEGKPKERKEPKKP